MPHYYIKQLNLSTVANMNWSNYTLHATEPYTTIYTPQGIIRVKNNEFQKLAISNDNIKEIIINGNTIIVDYSTRTFHTVHSQLPNESYVVSGTLCKYVLPENPEIKYVVYRKNNVLVDFYIESMLDMHDPSIHNAFTPFLI